MLLDRGPTFYRWSPRLAVVVTPRFSPGDVNAGANGIHPVQLRSAVGEGGGKVLSWASMLSRCGGYHGF